MCDRGSWLEKIGGPDGLDFGGNIGILKVGPTGMVALIDILGKIKSSARVALGTPPMIGSCSDDDDGLSKLRGSNADRFRRLVGPSFGEGGSIAGVCDSSRSDGRICE